MLDPMQTSASTVARATAVRSPSRSSAKLSEAWKKAQLQAITLHECRHTFASLMISGGVNAKALPPTWGTLTSRCPRPRTGTCCRATRRRRRGCWTLIWPATPSAISDGVVDNMFERPPRRPPFKKPLA